MSNVQGSKTFNVHCWYCKNPRLREDTDAECICNADRRCMDKDCLWYVPPRARRAYIEKIKQESGGME